MVGFRDANHAFDMRRQAAEMLAEAGRLDAAAAEADRVAREAAKPKMPSVENGPAFVTFTRYLSGREYTYAAVGWRVGRSVRWSVTGQDRERFNWPGLLQFVGDANWPSLTVLTPGDPLITPEAAPPVVERMGQFGRVLSSEIPTGDPHVGLRGRGRLLGPRFGDGRDGDYI